VCGQRVGHATNARESLIDLLFRPFERWRGPRNSFTSFLLRLDAESFEPVPQLERRDAVIAVVRPDSFANLRRETLGFLLRDRILNSAKVPGHLAQVDLPREPVEWFELLDRVALDSGAQRLADDAVKINEGAAAQKLVELVRPRSVPAHQPLHGGG